MEKMQISLAPGAEKAEIIIRELSTLNELAVKPPIKILLVGVLACVVEFLSKRISEKDQINEKKSHILVDREKLAITLVMHEDDEYKKGTVKGCLELNSKFKEFGINTGKVWTPTELGLFFKMNRAFFSDKAINMSLVSQLMHFTATVNSSIERAAKENGDRTDNFAQTVNSNLPKAFTLNIPVFKGKPTESLEVETFAQINGREVAFTLLSPAANQLMEEIRDKEIDEQLERIREIAPDIAIIEQ